MRNFNREQHDERGSILVGYLVGFAAGALIWGIDGYSMGYQHGKDVGKTNQAVSQTVQLHNEELRGELNTAFPAQNTLVLNEQTMTFTFNTPTAQGTNEQCSGNYELQNNTAHIVGQLACTQAVPAR